MSEKYPLISCICVTYRKPESLKNAIACFEAQTYPHKELIILFEDHDQETVAFLTNDLTRTENIRTIGVAGSPKKTLGELRNIALQCANGVFVCQWDDDDWFHTERIDYQYNIIAENGVNGCILTRWIIFDQCGERVFISNQRLWEGSLMCKRDVLMAKKYENKAKGEDTDVVNYLYDNGHLIGINDRPELYVYIYHGKNTWDITHFTKIFNASSELPGAAVLLADIVLNKYAPGKTITIFNEWMYSETRLVF